MVPRSRTGVGKSISPGGNEARVIDGPMSRG
jgi:hypothetical protein